jgi:hypothetical protein
MLCHYDRFFFIKVKALEERFLVKNGQSSKTNANL